MNELKMNNWYEEIIKKGLNCEICNKEEIMFFKTARYIWAFCPDCYKIIEDRVNFLINKLTEQLGK